MSFERERRNAKIFEQICLQIFPSIFRSNLWSTAHLRAKRRYKKLVLSNFGHLFILFILVCKIYKYI